MPWLLLLILASTSCGQTLTVTGPATATPGATITVSLVLSSPGPDLAALQWTLELPTGATSTVDGGTEGIAAGKTLSCAGYLCILSGLNTTTIQPGVVAQYQITLPATPGSAVFSVSGMLGASGIGEPVAVAAGAPYTVQISDSGPPYPVTDLRVEIAEAGEPTMATVNGTVAAGADDYQTAPGGGGAGSIVSNDSTIWFGRWAGDLEFGGVRFVLDAAIPSGATINSATLRLYGGGDADVSDIWFYVVDSSDPGQITTWAARPQLNGGSTATLPNTEEGSGSIHRTSAWASSGANDTDVAGLIQLLVNKYSGLGSGAHVHVVFHGDAGGSDLTESSFRGYEAGTNIPTLTITYTAGEAAYVPYPFSRGARGGQLAHSGGLQ